MRTKVILYVCLLLGSYASQAQFIEDEGPIRQTIFRLFRATQIGDTATVRACFHPSARLQTVTTDPNTGVTILETTTVEDYIAQVQRILEKQILIEERVTMSEIESDLPLASVWANYDFYVDGNKTHSGIDAFQLIKTQEGWKIIQLSDTRKK